MRNTKPTPNYEITDDYLLIFEPNAILNLLDCYSLTAEQLLVVLRLAKRRLQIANKLFNGPELNQVSYKTIVWCQQFYAELTERIEFELLQIA